MSNESILSILDVNDLINEPDAERIIAKLWARRTPGEWNASGCILASASQGFTHAVGATLKAPDAAIIAALVSHWPEASEELSSLRAAVMALYRASFIASQALREAHEPGAVAGLLDEAIRQATDALGELSKRNIVAAKDTVDR